LKFSEKLRILIEDNNLTQKRVATDLNIPVSTLGGYVQGTSEPDFETLKLLADYFSVTTDYMLDYHPGNCSNKEAEVLNILKSLAPKQQQLFIEQGKTIIKVYSNEKE